MYSKLEKRADFGVLDVSSLDSMEISRLHKDIEELAEIMFASLCPSVAFKLAERATLTSLRGQANLARYVTCLMAQEER